MSNLSNLNNEGENENGNESELQFLGRIREEAVKNNCFERSFFELNNKHQEPEIPSISQQSLDKAQESVREE